MARGDVSGDRLGTWPLGPGSGSSHLLGSEEKSPVSMVLCSGPYSGRFVPKGLRGEGIRGDRGPGSQASGAGHRYVVPGQSLSSLLPASHFRMPWQGDTNNMIDRFDVRAHLDHIPDYTPPLLTTM